MSVPLAVGGGPSAYWYLTRSTGAVALLLLTLAVTLGVLDVRRLSTPRWPRFVVDSLHRDASLLAVAFVTLHVITSVLDSFAPISLVAAFIPFTSSYRPLWLGLGAVSFDLLLALVVTSLMRGIVSQALWRRVHWLAYACWPVALLHSFGTGSDPRQGWFMALSVACILAVLAAVLARALSARGADPRVRRSALAGAGAFSLFLAIWIPTGPMASDWASRAGTPASLLSHPHRSAASASVHGGGGATTTAASGGEASASANETAESGRGEGERR
jgi:sulfoxide reductase heme-binding subunit YedZ